MPAPISPNSGAFSTTCTGRPVCAMARASVRPPMPPPTIRVGSLSMGAFPSRAIFVRTRIILRKPRRRKRGPDQGLLGEEAVGWPRQTEVFAQRPAFVFAAENTAALQLGHNLVDEVVEPGR